MFEHYGMQTRALGLQESDGCLIFRIRRIDAKIQFLETWS
jgi:hypothetical protein